MLYAKNAQRVASSIFLLAATTIPIGSFADSKNKDSSIANSVITKDIFEKAKSNDNWKLAFTTGKHAQIVFMSVSPLTNPQNEIGMETHAFDQVIIIVEGKGKADLNGTTSIVNANDMIFIPEGTPHNIINLDEKKPLKLISIYSETDIPANSVLKKKSDSLKN